MTAPENMTSLEMAQRWMLAGALLTLVCLLFLCLVRAVKGPRVADRIVAVNMMGTMVMVIIGIMTLLLGEGYLADICLIYAMISFLAVIVLSKVYMGVYRQRREQELQKAHDGGREDVPKDTGDQSRVAVLKDRNSSMPGQAENRTENREEKETVHSLEGVAKGAGAPQEGGGFHV